MTPRSKIWAEPQRPERSGEPATVRQLALLRQLARRTGEVDPKAIDGLSWPEAEALIGRILDRHPEEQTEADARRRRQARRSGGRVSAIWAMDLEKRGR